MTRAIGFDGFGKQVMWKILASPDGFAWIEVEDQATPNTLHPIHPHPTLLFPASKSKF